jgi:hypothetical protein
MAAGQYGIRRSIETVSGDGVPLRFGDGLKVWIAVPTWSAGLLGAVGMGMRGENPFPD